MRIRSTNRGFGVYAEGVDVGHNKLIVSQSSLASQDAVRIYADNPYKDGGNKFDCIHVNEEGAKLIIQGLQSWINELKGV